MSKSQNQESLITPERAKEILKKYNEVRNTSFSSTNFALFDQKQQSTMSVTMRLLKEIADNNTQSVDAEKKLLTFIKNKDYSFLKDLGDTLAAKGNFSNLYEQLNHLPIAVQERKEEIASRKAILDEERRQSELARTLQAAREAEEKAAKLKIAAQRKQLIAGERQIGVTTTVDIDNLAKKMVEDNPAALQSLLQSTKKTPEIYSSVTKIISGLYLLHNKGKPESITTGVKLTKKDLDNLDTAIKNYTTNDNEEKKILEGFASAFRAYANQPVQKPTKAAEPDQPVKKTTRRSASPSKDNKKQRRGPTPPRQVSARPTVSAKQPVTSNVDSGLPKSKVTKPVTPALKTQASRLKVNKASTKRPVTSKVDSGLPKSKTKPVTPALKTQASKSKSTTPNLRDKAASLRPKVKSTSKNGLKKTTPNKPNNGARKAR